MTDRITSSTTKRRGLRRATVGLVAVAALATTPFLASASYAGAARAAVADTRTQVTKRPSS